MIKYRLSNKNIFLALVFWNDCTRRITQRNRMFGFVCVLKAKWWRLSKIWVRLNIDYSSRQHTRYHDENNASLSHLFLKKIVVDIAIMKKKIKLSKLNRVKQFRIWSSRSQISGHNSTHHIRMHIRMWLHIFTWKKKKEYWKDYIRILAIYFFIVKCAPALIWDQCVRTAHNRTYVVK